MFRLTAVLFSLVLCCVYTTGMPIPAKQQVKVIEFLVKYGYLAPLDSGRPRTEQELEEAVLLFQRASGLKETGSLTDEQTLNMTLTSRCGLSDIGPAERARKRKKRYALQGTKWYKKSLSFKIVNYTPDLPRKDTRSTIVAALQMWSKVVPLTFTETTKDDADIKIKFITGYSHGDNYPFDGTGGTLAHAFYPYNNRGNAGDVHFDEAETFTLRNRSGVNLLWVAVHEFGHSLGLDHSFHPKAVMNAFYKGYSKQLQLHSDDIQGIQQLYGKPNVEPQTPTPYFHRRTPRPGVPRICGTSLDAIVYSPTEGVTYAFKGKYFWPLSDQGYFTDGPLKIREFWPRMRGNIDTAVTLADKTTLFFKGARYWVFRGRNYLRGPLKITDKSLNLPAELKNMDAAFRWGGNGHIYFFKGDRYWRYNYRTKQVGHTYPRLIRVSWKGVPDNLDSVMQWKNGKSYFFKGQQYYGIDDYSTSVSRGYPKDIATYWMACSLEGLKNGGRIAPLKSPDKTPADRSSGNRNWSIRSHLMVGVALLASILYIWSGLN